MQICIAVTGHAERHRKHTTKIFLAITRTAFMPVKLLLPTHTGGTYPTAPDEPELLAYSCISGLSMDRF